MDNETWLDVRKEYTTTDISTRELARKYDIPYGTLRKRATREKWAQERAQMGAEMGAGRAQAVREVEYEDYKGLLLAAGLLSDKIAEAVQLMSAEDVLKDKRGLRSLTGAIKDLADIQGLNKSDTQAAEAISVVINGADGFCER